MMAICSCDSMKTKPQNGNLSYDALYTDSFDILINQLGDSVTYVDTLYTEMYIALKSMSPGDDGQCAKMVIEKVDKLMELDTIKENQIQYLEAKQIAQSVLKDKKGFIETIYQQINLYPENSFERLGSLGSFFLATNQTDSANYYLNKCIQVSKENLNSGNDEIKEKGIMGVLHGLVLLNKDQEAKSFIKEQLQIYTSGEIEELLRSIDEDFDGFKQMELESAKLI